LNTLIPPGRHVAFHEQLAITDPSSEAWRGVAAGLHALRLVDAWCRRSDRPARVSTRQLRAVGRLAKRARGETRQRLLTVVDAIASRGPRAADAAARALLDHAIALRFEMEWHLAIDILRTVIERLGRAIDDAILLEAMAQCGFALRLAGRFQESRVAYLALRREAKRCQNVEYSIRSDVGLANILMERGNFPAAQSLVENVIVGLRVSPKPHLQPMLSRALHTRANIAQGRGRYAEALPIISEALELCADPAEREAILHDIAAALIGLGCLSPARDALILLRKTAINQATVWSASVNLMEIAAREGRTESFERWRGELESQRLRPVHRAQFLYLAGEGYERLQQYERAREMYETAVVAGETLGINDVVIRAEERMREVRARRYLPARATAYSASPDVEQVIEAVTELCVAAGISVGADDP
jgi:tetratricopeptide (TPR) repeat protein